MELKDLLDNPRTAPFSRLKYLQRFASEKEVAEFLNGLFNETAEARYSGQWERVEGFLDRWEDLAIDRQFRTLGIEMSEPVPWETFDKPLSEARIALVTTGGVYVEGQDPFSRGDVSYREIARDTPARRFRIWHPGYDNGPALQDINCILPIDRFQELESEGLIGELAQTSYSFMGLIQDQDALLNRTAPEAARQMVDAGVDAVFLAST